MSQIKGQFMRAATHITTKHTIYTRPNYFLQLNGIRKELDYNSLVANGLVFSHLGFNGCIPPVKSENLRTVLQYAKEKFEA
ncbi:hypothetical protein L5515_019650 [Caenorhabditis briggsae]|uniref:Uncharacterized protein n=1 Tax=Caenorhabditis briggsae TaxID=6238 RepID=A0AAE9FPV8_CAEBR|nr:hypothetical protein L3Y34_013828 [Caenorhabditis briggsae]UMM44510.1 hypothetical protein L5515_019650 [Caenorhabditis briggsae]